MKRRKGFTLLEYDEVKNFFLGAQVDRRIREIQNHHTYLPDYSSFKRRPDPFYWLESMRNYHVGNNGWSDIAQNITTFPDGTVAICRPLEHIPAGIKGHNGQGICIEHLGNFDAGHDRMSEAHKDTVIHLNAVLLDRFNLDATSRHIIYHHWFHTKTCPGTAFFGGNARDDAENGFIPLVKAELQQLQKEAAPAAEANEKPLGYRIVTASALNVRSGPGSRNPKEGMVIGGNILPVYESVSGWARISRTHSRWVSVKYLHAVEKGMVTADALNVRSGPASSSRVLTTVSRGEEVVVYEQRRGWYRIDLNEKWVSGRYVQFI